MSNSSSSFGKRQATGYGGVERRRSTRQKSTFNALIITATGEEIQCCIVNKSAAGALILVSTVLGVPHQFELVEGSGKPRRVEVARRFARHVGVKFMLPRSGS